MSDRVTLALTLAILVPSPFGRMLLKLSWTGVWVVRSSGWSSGRSESEASSQSQTREPSRRASLEQTGAGQKQGWEQGRHKSNCSGEQSIEQLLQFLVLRAGLVTPLRQSGHLVNPSIQLRLTNWSQAQLQALITDHWLIVSL